MTLKVIGAGFGRTGTLSLKAALEKLGYDKTHHMLEVFPNKKQKRLWHDVAMKREVDWDDVFEGFQASVDFPSSTYYNELLAHFPDAKVVLTVRDPDKWYQSASQTIYKFHQAFPKWSRKIIPEVKRNLEMVDGCVWDRVFQGRFEDEAYTKQVFVDYIEQVKKDVPADKLLVFEVKQGWDPICKFLGKDVPDEPFPHENDTAQFQKMIRGIKSVFLALYVVVVGLLGWLIYSLLG